MVITGCRTPPPMESTALTEAEKSALTRRAKPPQVFGVTAHTAEGGVVFAGIFRQHRNHVGTLELFEDKKNLIPAVTINDDRALMLIDPASAESWLTVEASTRLNAVALVGPDLFERMPAHVVDQTGGFAAIVPKITLGQAHVENALFYIRNARGPLDNLARGENKARLDGVLGADALRAFEFVRISLKSGQLIVSGSSVYPYSGNALAATALLNVRGGLGVEAMIDGEKIKMLLDLAGRFEVAIPEPESPLIRQITIGDVVFRQVEAISTLDAGLGIDSPARIGRKLLERYDLVINQRGKQLLFERPTE